jgi:hypothetical protein
VQVLGVFALDVRQTFACHERAGVGLALAVSVFEVSFDHLESAGVDMFLMRKFSRVNSRLDQRKLNSRFGPVPSAFATC